MLMGMYNAVSTTLGITSMNREAPGIAYHNKFIK